METAWFRHVLAKKILAWWPFAGRSDVKAICHIHSVPAVLAAENQDVPGRCKARHFWKDFFDWMQSVNKEIPSTSSMRPVRSLNDFVKVCFLSFQVLRVRDTEMIKGGSDGDRCDANKSSGKCGNMCV